jgi:hypothetical protein
MVDSRAPKNMQRALPLLFVVSILGCGSESETPNNNNPVDSSPSDDTAIVDDGAVVDDAAPDAAPSECPRTPRPEGARKVVVSHPFLDGGAKTGAMEVLDLASDGTLTRPMKTFALGAAAFEPIAFTPDGRIPEVPMTSQGAGRPFGAGEPIEAWRACGMSGGAYVGPDADGTHPAGSDEALIAGGDGSQATYRYARWEWPVGAIDVQATGSGEITVCLDGEGVPAGRAVIRDGRQVEGWMAGPAGSHEVVLRFGAVDGLVLHGFTLG